ncbi:MAG: dihydrofolate reductase [Lysobacterales bacterium]
MQKNLTLIAAMGENRAIGLNGRMPWHLPEELQHFKRATMGKALVMGRKTWQAIGRPLPGRQNIVVSKNPAFTAAGADVCQSLDAAVHTARSEEIMVIGGGQLYALALPRAQRMILTLIEVSPEADTWFPRWSERHWREVDEERFEARAGREHAYRIVTLERIAS